MSASTPARLTLNGHTSSESRGDDIAEIVRELPPILQEWIRQILSLSPEMLTLLRGWNGQIDVLLRANRGRVSHRPSVAFDRGAVVERELDRFAP